MSISRTELLVTRSFSPKHSATATDIPSHPESSPNLQQTEELGKESVLETTEQR